MTNQKPEIDADPIVLGDHADLRAERSWLVSDVLFLTWAFFAIYFTTRDGYESAAVSCILQCFVYVITVFMFRKSKDYREAVILFFITSGFGVFWVACVDIRLSRTMFFFPVSIVVASQLFGIRQAALWCFMSIAAFVGYFVIVVGLQGTMMEHFDALMISLGITVCLFFCCRQAEALFHAKTKGLIELSDSLRKKRDELHVLAMTDGLTGLTNRFQFQIELEKSIESATEEKKTVLCLIDLDRFNEINDTLGHVVGDEVLVHVAQRLVDGMNGRGTIARLGGDEFCVLVDDIVDHGEALALATNAYEWLTQEPYQLRENELALESSVGFAICPDHATTEREFLSYADTAMYNAKQNKLRVSSYDASMTERLVEKREMDGQLRDALAREEFFLVYQPQLDIASGNIVGVEALLRWRCEGKVIYPQAFVPRLEETGLIVPVSKWVIRQACRQQQAWRDRGYDIRVAVNISAVQFEDDEFVENISEAIAEFDVSPCKIELELTEGLLVNDIALVVEKLNHIKSAGLEISIDDFGTGYSSLFYLQQFPLDKLKIDRAFVKDIPENDDGVIASSVIALAQLLGMKCIAEGVETAAQLQFLNSHGCDQYQGHHFSRPVGADELLRLLEANPDRIEKVEFISEA